jgi:3-hydroxyacyl-CoA dehydrogenase/enoyl-CoA hydratase/3-hydroxybutyryl-CoA epimerase
MSAFQLVDHSEYAPGLFCLSFDLKTEKVNKLGPDVIKELDEVLNVLKTKKEIKTLVFISGKESIFIAGADIDVIKTIHDAQTGAKLARDGQAVLARFEELPYPVIAAIHGAAMGGGTELALCCSHIVVSDSPSTKIALPEVNLGILPGFGGTIRMPERIGLQPAMDYILTGKTMNADKAFKLGFADAVVSPHDFKNNVFAFAKKSTEWHL